MQQKTLLQSTALGVDLASDESTSKDQTVICQVRYQYCENGKSVQTVIVDDLSDATPIPLKLYDDPVNLKLYRDLRSRGASADDAVRTLELMGHKANRLSAEWDYQEKRSQHKLPYYHGKRRF